MVGAGGLIQILLFFEISLIQISISLICLVHHHRRTMADVALRQAAELKPALWLWLTLTQPQADLGSVISTSRAARGRTGAPRRRRFFHLAPRLRGEKTKAWPTDKKSIIRGDVARGLTCSKPPCGWQWGPVGLRGGFVAANPVLVWHRHDATCRVSIFFNAFNAFSVSFRNQRNVDW